MEKHLRAKRRSTHRLIGRDLPRRRERQLDLERLEERTLLASTPTLLKDINTFTNNSNPGSFSNVAGTVFFSADDGLNGRELWKTDGTGAGSVLVKDIWAGLNSALAGPNPNSQFFVNV